MKGTSCILRHLLQYLALGTVIMAVSFCADGQPTLSAHIGIEGKTTPGRFAPVRIGIRNYREAGAAVIRIQQRVGNAWHGTAEVEQILPHEVQSDGIYESVLPIYDPANPLAIDLIAASDGRLLASATVDLRADMSASPFIAQDRLISRLDEQAAIIDPKALPTQWWALSGIDSLWIASPLSSRTWDSVTRWVTAGGSLVVFTGTDFFRMDSSQLRQLLPVTNPTVDSEDGAVLTGELRDHAVVNLLTPEGTPLMIHWQVGGGHVSLVTAHAHSLEPELLRTLRSQVPPATLISLTTETDQLLGQWSIVALSSLAVLGLCVLLVAGVIGSVLLGRRSAIGGWVTIGGWVMLLSVLFGLISNPAMHRIDLYIANTSLQIINSLGLKIDYSSFHYQVTKPVIWHHGEGAGIPGEVLPHSLRDVASRDSQTLGEETSLQASSGDTRHWVNYSESTPTFSLTRQPESAVQITNLLGERIERGWLLQDGFIISMPPVERGTHTYELPQEDVVRLATFLARPDPDHEDMSALVLLKALSKQLPLKHGVWYIAMQDRESVIVDETSRKVRDLTLVLVQEDDVSDEI